jgi:hypothetical protein
MGSLRSALDELAGEDVESLSDVVLENDLAELLRDAEALESQVLRRLVVFDRRRTYQRDGHLSTVSFLVDRFRLSRSRAAELVRLARALEHMPLAREAFASAAISAASVRALVEARQVHPEAYADAEELLVQAARSLSGRQLHQAISHWKQLADTREGGVGDEDLRARRNLHVSSTIFGMVRVDGDLDPESGERLLTALRAVMDAEARSEDGDDRTPAQRRADALGEICGLYLNRSDRPMVAGERPHVTVTVDLEALAGRSGKAEFDLTGPIRGEAARLVACDASVSRVITGPRSEPLDVGRKTPVVHAALRRAVTIRDRHCRFPGCDRPQAWCDAHHVVHWADGGPTALSNLVLLCRRHHRLVHDRGGFRAEMIEGRPVFRRPDGSILEERAPP